MDVNSKFSARNSTFLNHSKALYGAIIYGSQNSKIDLRESTLHFNQGKFGGVIYIANCTLKIVDTSFESNNATDGGVICAMFSNVHIHNSSCINNFANGHGGCLNAASSNMSITNSDMSFNYAFSGGAVMIHPNSDFNVIETKFHNNKTVTAGGAIYRRQSGHLALDQCSFRNNCVNDSYGTLGSDIGVIEVDDVRLSQCNLCTMQLIPRQRSVSQPGEDIWTTILSFKTNILFGSKTLSSTDPLFLNKAIARKWIYRNSAVMQHETKFASCKYLDYL